jgi:hypothetical protein
MSKADTVAGPVWGYNLDRLDAALADGEVAAVRDAYHPAMKAHYYALAAESWDGSREAESMDFDTITVRGD